MKLSPTRKVILTAGTASIALAVILMISNARLAPPQAPTRPRVPPEKTSGKFSFLVVGDSAGGIITFRNIISSMNADRAAFAVHLGDMAYEGRDYQYRAFLNQIKQLQIPLFTSPGNHDVMIGDPGRENYKKYFGPADYSFTAGNSFFIFLDSSRETVSPEQLAWLERELEGARGLTHRFVFTHVPLYDPRENTPGDGHCLDDLSQARALNAILDRHAVTMLFAGHIHAYFRGVWGQTPFIITGGGGQNLMGTDPENNFNHYLRVTVDGSRVEYNVVKIERTVSRPLENLANELNLLTEPSLLSKILLALGLALSAFALLAKPRTAP